ncbi:Metal-sulfur cluster biosynthetic enzyme [Planifilum fulgidum]|uniref:Metal-sulfur cluster biosynthetic enzyme n=1 Tax=Planifilum fulgidum TaxID=201973 RepID=A0A1I2MFB3_9BACL|nr:Metal-sulfur cluster biosynthetic enzyme [Planifilum fulgidum]
MIHLKPEEIRELLREVYDPELGVNIVDLGLVYEIRNDDGDVYIRMTLTTPGCPLHDTIASAVERLLEGQPGIRSVKVDIVWNPPWSPDKMSEEAKRQLGFFG